MARTKIPTLVAGSLMLLVCLSIVMYPGRVVSENPADLRQEFIGSAVCSECHADPELSESGFNIWEEAQKEAHWFALSLPNPQFPEGTNDTGIMPPPGTSWDEYAYVMGGYGWKTTFVKKDGSQLTGAENVQYDLETGEWTAYHPGETLDFDVECARCHTTGITSAGSWNGVEADSLGTFAEIGVRCEGCHGPSSLHATRAFTTSEGETDVLQDRCGDCHNNGGRESPIPVVDGFVANHVQYQELEASRHGSVSFFTCTTCHEPHVSLKYSGIIGNTFNGKPLDPFRSKCQDCHPTREANHPAPIECVDCHMPSASKSAVGIEYDNGGLRGDIASHIWRINTNAVSRDSMLSEDGSFLKPDASGWLSVTMDFACLGCHTEETETLEWAASYAKTMHAPEATDIEDLDVALPRQARVVSNYPNPFATLTTIIYELEAPSQVSLSVYNSSGERVALLEQGDRSPGAYEAIWDGRSDAGIEVASGVYLARLEAGHTVHTHKLLRVR